MTLDLDTAWAQAYPLPPAGNMMTHGEEVFVRQGTRMAAVVAEVIAAHLSAPIGELDILDFGCGVGRVALPLFHRYGRPNACADVDVGVIAYLSNVIPDANPVLVGHMPPSPFDEAAFDVVFAISVWTHLDLSTQDAWLIEFRRILKPNGIAILTTAGYTALGMRQREAPEIADFSADDLRRIGMIFRPRFNWAAHDPDWAREHWASVMTFVETRIAAIEGRQDLHVLCKH